MHRRECGSAHPQGTIHPRQDVLEGLEHGLRREGPQGLTAHEEGGSVGLVHEIQLGAHGGKQRGRGLLRGLESRQPVQRRGHVGVLQRGRGAVPAREELQGLDLPLVHPPGPGGRRDEDDGPVERARAVQLGDDRGGRLLNARPARGHPGVDADGLHRHPTTHLRDVEARGAAPKEDAPLPTHRLPGDGRGRGRRTLRDDRLVDAARRAHVQLLGLAAKETDAASQDDFGRQEEHDREQDHHAHHDGGRARHVRIQGCDEHPTQPVQGSNDTQQHP